jgi:hypothetical protein
MTKTTVMRPEGTISGKGWTGVCHVTATAKSNSDVATLLVRLVMTLDVDSIEATTRYALGPDAACRELRWWMRAMCTAAAANDNHGEHAGEPET